MNSKFHRYRMFFPVIFFAVFFAITYVVMLLWNAILPSVTGAGSLTYWQAAGILILSKILFGFPGWGKNHHHSSFRGGFRDKWMHMPEEEKEKFREEWKKRCHG